MNSAFYMLTRAAVVIAITCSAIACGPGEAIGEGAESGSEGTLGGDGRAGGDCCPPPLPCLPIADGSVCDVGDCEVTGDRLSCHMTMVLPVGHTGDVAMSTPLSGDLPWNELPWNADGGEFEHPNFVSTGDPMCGVLTISTDAVVENDNGERWVGFICENSTLGVFQQHKIEI